MFDKENFIVTCAVLIISVFIKAIAFWLLWDWLITYVIDLPEITIWQSIGGWFLWAIVTLKLNLKKK